MIKFNKIKLAWILICVCLFPVSILPLSGQVMTWDKLEEYKDKFDNAERALGNALLHLEALARERGDIKVAWDVNREELRDQAIQAAAGAVKIAAMSALSPIAPSGLVSELSNAMVLASLSALDVSEKVTLDSLFSTAIGAVNSKLNEIDDADSGLVKARNDAFEEYRKAYKKYYSPSAEPTLRPQWTVPHVSKYSFSCFGNSSCGNTFDTPTEAVTGDLVSCSVKPHSGYGWYKCRHSSCPAASEHWVECRATSCTVLFPPPTVTIVPPEYMGTVGYTKIEHHDHEVTCEKTVYSWIPGPKCRETYFTCEHSRCPKWKRHWSSDSSSDSTPNCPDCTTHCSPPCLCTNSGTCNGSASTPSTPTYHACGEHETTVSGDHSNGTYTCGSHSGYKCQESHDHETYISSCTSTDSYGNTCNNTSGYYECSQHSHTYPNMVTCDAGHSYREDHPNVEYLNNLHRTRTCRFSGCGNSWQACSIVGWSPYCNNAYRKSKGWKCGE